MKHIQKQLILIAVISTMMMGCNSSQGDKNIVNTDEKGLFSNTTNPYNI